MTTLNTTEDLLRAARENPEFREAFRREILTDDLINLPQRVDDYQAETTKNINALTSNIADLTKSVATLNQGITQIRRAHRQEHDAMHRFRGNYAIETARNNDVTIAERFTNELDIRRFQVRSVSREERNNLINENLDAIDQLDTEGNTDTSLPTGDIIAEVSHRRSNDTIFYLAVEASYTVNADDVIRASDHAKILRTVTGHDAFAIVSGVEVNPEIGNTYRQRIIYDLAEYMESKQDDVVFWFQLADSSLEPPPPC